MVVATKTIKAIAAEVKNFILELTLFQGFFLKRKDYKLTFF